MPIYSFRTSKSWRIDAVAKNPKQGFLVAQQNVHKMILASAGMDTCIFGDRYLNAMDRFNEIYGQVLPEYITYIRGIARVDNWKQLVKA